MKLHEQRDHYRELASSRKTFIEDLNGDVIEQEVFCSDNCARTSKHYNAWNGCHEISMSEPCTNCGEQVHGIEIGENENEIA